MKAEFSESYYRENYSDKDSWSKYLKKVPREMINLAPDMWHMHIEKELEFWMSGADEHELHEDVYKYIKESNARKVYEKDKAILLNAMAIVKSLDAGKISFGYATEEQEAKARCEFKKFFEYKCLQLADFRKKHGLDNRN